MKQLWRQSDFRLKVTWSTIIQCVWRRVDVGFAYTRKFIPQSQKIVYVVRFYPRRRALMHCEAPQGWSTFQWLMLFFHQVFCVNIQALMQNDPRRCAPSGGALATMELPSVQKKKKKKISNLKDRKLTQLTENCQLLLSVKATPNRSLILIHNCYFLFVTYN